MRYGTPRMLTGANDRDTREHRVRRKGINNRPLDVEPILQERNSSVAGSDSRRDHIRHKGRHISNVLGGDNHEVKRGDVLLRDVGYAIAN